MTNFDRFHRESIFDLDSIANLWGIGASIVFQIIQYIINVSGELSPTKL